MHSPSWSRQRWLVAAAAVGVVACGAAPKKQAAAPVASETVRTAPKKSSDSAKEFQMQGELGVLEPEQIEAPFKTQQPAVMACFDAGLVRNWFLGGGLEFKVRVHPDGQVKDVAVTRPLGDGEVERCMVGVVRAMRFDAPKGGAEAEFSYPLEFHGKAQMHAWGNAEVARVFAQHAKDVARCGAQRVHVRAAFFVGPGGVAKPVGIGGDGDVDPAYARCVAQAIARWKFDDPRGRMARVVYDFPDGSAGASGP